MAETRETQVLEDVINGDEIMNPRTTEEAILAQIIAGDEVTINVRTSYQAYLKELSSISGGNPNKVETYSGTLKNPFVGIERVDYLRGMLNSNNATLILTATFQGLTMKSYMNPDGIYNISFSDIFYADDAVNEGFKALWIVHGGTTAPDLMYAYITQAGVTINAYAYAELIPTTLTVIYHPLP